jgi:hypothetical protein
VRVDSWLAASGEFHSIGNLEIKLCSSQLSGWISDKTANIIFCGSISINFGATKWLSDTQYFLQTFLWFFSVGPWVPRVHFWLVEWKMGYTSLGSFCVVTKSLFVIVVSARMAWKTTSWRPRCSQRCAKPFLQKPLSQTDFLLPHKMTQGSCNPFFIQPVRSGLGAPTVLQRKTKEMSEENIECPTTT